MKKDGCIQLRWRIVIFIRQFVIKNVIIIVSDLSLVDAQPRIMAAFITTILAFLDIQKRTNSVVANMSWGVGRTFVAIRIPMRKRTL